MTTFEFRRIRTHDDGTSEVYVPALNRDGYFVLSDTAVLKQHNKAENNFYVRRPEAVAGRLRRAVKEGDTLRIRMQPQGGGSHNLIAAKEVEIIER